MIQKYCKMFGYFVTLLSFPNSVTISGYRCTLLFSQIKHHRRTLLSPGQTTMFLFAVALVLSLSLSLSLSKKIIFSTFRTTTILEAEGRQI